MILTSFLNHFNITARDDDFSDKLLRKRANANLAELVSALGGCTFRQGLYRILRSDSIDFATKAMERAFPEYAGRIEAFGYDWLGRHFVIDLGCPVGGEPRVLMLEIGAGEAMEVPASLEDFHNIELVDYAEDALASNFWKEWQEVNKDPLPYSKCVGYKVPLFLGGEDDIENLEIIDLSVYVDICGQLRNETRSLKNGQTIGQISIDK